jgi:hypothetical protein
MWHGRPLTLTRSERKTADELKPVVMPLAKELYPKFDRWPDYSRDQALRRLIRLVSILRMLGWTPPVS